MASEVNDEIVMRNPNADYNKPSEYQSVNGWWGFYTVSIGCPIAIFGGVFSNILAFVVLVRGRLWLKHEGYIYLAANFCANVAILLFCTSSFWLTSVSKLLLYYPPNTSNFMCIVWRFFMSIFFASGWLCVALLFNVYIREHMVGLHRRCGCPMFAAKYCTLFASKIIVGVILSLLLVLGIPYLTIFECQVHMSQSVALVIALITEWIIMWVLPLVFFLPIILLMTLCSKRKSNNFGFSQIEVRSVSDEQMRVVAVTLSTMTLFSQFDLATAGAMIFVSKYVFLSVGEFAVPAHGLSIAIQPILCFIILKALREEFCSQLRSTCCCRLLPSLDREEEAVQLRVIQEDTNNTAGT